LHTGRPRFSTLRLGADLLFRRWWVLDELDTLFDVALQTFDGIFDELLLVLIGAAERVGGLLCARGLDYD
jgi:hypothetical protein